MAKKYVLEVVKTSGGWKIDSNISLANWAGAEATSKKKNDVINRAYKLAVNLSKTKGVTVQVEVHSASGTLQTTAEW